MNYKSARNRLVVIGLITMIVGAAFIGMMSSTFLESPLSFLVSLGGGGTYGVLVSRFFQRKQDELKEIERANLREW